MKKLLVTAVVIAIAATFVNDVGRYAKARYDASNIAAESARLAAQDRSNTRNENAMVAAQYAAAQGATVYQFDQDSERVYVWVEFPLTSTWVLGPFTAWQNEQPLTTPYMVRIDDTAFID